MKRWLQNNTTMSEENEGASCSKNGSTHGNKHRKFLEEYITFGFTSINVNNDERPQCVICYEILSDESMKPANFRRVEKTAIGTNNERSVTESYQISLLVANVANHINYGFCFVMR